MLLYLLVTHAVSLTTVESSVLQIDLVYFTL